MSSAVYAYGDESADEACQRVFAVAALCGPDANWQSAEAQWKAIAGDGDFHAAEWETEYVNDPDRAKHKTRLAEYRKLIEVLAASYLLGWGTAIDLAAYNELFPNVPKDREYYKCFTDVVAAIMGKICDLNDVKKPDEPVYLCHFTFDQNIRLQRNAEELYRSFLGGSDWTVERPFMGDGLKFDSRKNPRVQMADVFARETMKELERTLLENPRPRRGSLTALLEANGRFAFQIMTRQRIRRWQWESQQFARDAAEHGDFDYAEYASG